jgi:predicted nuclease with RNAse H fold
MQQIKLPSTSTTFDQTQRFRRKKMENRKKKIKALPLATPMLGRLNLAQNKKNEGEK